MSAMRILVLDDDRVDRLAVRRAIAASGMDAELLEADSLSAARGLLSEPPTVDAIVAEHVVGDGSAAELLQELRAQSELPPVVVLTGQGDERVAVDAMKAGAADYLTKTDLSPRRLRKVLRGAVRVAAAEQYARDAREAEQRLLLELARERERLERAVAERDELLAIVSHDLRSPLANVSLALENLSEDDLDAAQRNRMTQLAQRSVERMLRLIEDLLDVTRIEQHGLVLDIADHDASRVLFEAVDAMRLSAEQKGVWLEVAVHPALGTIEVDRVRFAQVFQNLLSNAIRFTPEGGTIRVRAAPEGSSIRFEVHDEGPGVPPELRPHIFDRFWQARRSARSGVGLGLAIVKGIVEAHWGGVRIADSERGARFVLTFPRRRR